MESLARFILLALNMFWWGGLHNTPRTFACSTGLIIDGSKWYTQGSTSGRARCRDFDRRKAPHGKRWGSAGENCCVTKLSSLVYKNCDVNLLDQSTSDLDQDLTN